MTASPRQGPRRVRRRRRVVAISGGGVAAIEALLGLRALLGLPPHVDLIAPNRRFVYQPFEAIIRLRPPGAAIGSGRHGIGKQAADAQPDLRDVVHAGQAAGEIDGVPRHAR